MSNTLNRENKEYGRVDDFLVKEYPFARKHSDSFYNKRISKFNNQY